MKLVPKIQSVQEIISESDKANRDDIEWLSNFLREYRRNHAPTLGDSTLIDRLKNKFLADRDAVTEAKQLWLEKSERKLAWLNLRRLTNDSPFWGHFESAIQILENHEKLPFKLFEPISGCQGDYPVSSVGQYFKNARMGRIFTVYKMLLMYSLFVVADQDEEMGKKNNEKTREYIYFIIQANTQYVYQIDVPPVLHSLLSECYLYQRVESGSAMLIPNCGYVFGGEVQPVAPYNRGLDCTSFTGWITGCGRPLTYLYEIAWRMNRGDSPGRVITPEDKNIIKMLRERHDAIEPRGSEMRLGDILVWRHKDGSGHAMVVQRVVDDDKIMTVECTNYKDGNYEGFQERVVSILDPLGGRAMVLRPLVQHSYNDFRERNDAFIKDPELELISESLSMSRIELVVSEVN